MAVAEDERFRQPSSIGDTFPFAQVVEEKKLATLVGQATGGNRRGINGDAFVFVTLPGSGIEAELPLVATFASDDRPSGREIPFRAIPDAGIDHDVRVAPGVDDFARGADPELRAAMALLAGARWRTADAAGRQEGRAGRSDGPARAGPSGRTSVSGHGEDRRSARHARLASSGLASKAVIGSRLHLSRPGSGPVLFGPTPLSRPTPGLLARRPRQGYSEGQRWLELRRWRAPALRIPLSS